MPIVHKIQSTLTTSMTFARKEFSSRFDLNCFLGFRCSDILCTDKQRNARSDRLLNFILSFWLCETYFHKWFKNLHKLGSKFSTLVAVAVVNVVVKVVVSIDVDVVVVLAVVVVDFAVVVFVVTAAVANVLVVGGQLAVVLELLVVY